MKNPFAVKIGKQIRAKRKELNLTQKEFSKHFLGTEQNSYISNIEQGKLNLTLKECQKIFDFLDCTVSLNIRLIKEGEYNRNNQTV
jgi:transcriptional regulator with XRE-family HTH domain